MKRICFVFHSQGTTPSGGSKMIYEYADFLANYYKVEILHLAWKSNTTSILKGILKYLYFFNSFSPKKWFSFSNPVILKWIFTLSKINADIIVATAWETAELIYRLIGVKRPVVYFIQGDESLFDEPVRRNWQKRVRETWKYPWKKIVVADFLKNQILQYDKSGDIIKISNGINFNHFHITVPIIQRNLYSISMLAHNFFGKGTKDGLKALEIVRAKYPEIQVVFFSTYKKMEYIPEWIDYRYNPSQTEIVQIYNNSSIFISCSHTEGFGLPVAEAMACGCCTVVTDIPAYHDFTVPNETSLYYPVGDYHKLAEQITIIIENNTMREKLANNGYKLIQERLSFEQSCRKFLDVIRSVSIERLVFDVYL
jgi:glycosyltransferase involved in cell wall biosynthesis